ncbi:hypothetical protein QMK19_13485 [Streptomyces sp. H10-C2]|uniref:hypothetical protein n=1 Tax=unclassified Streptomyces TaxID=2593676 RepID=UPI0024B8E83F|nr:MULTISPECIES: hypothetical protein [unclassified Streptomyces]MDJ0343199.1 hypothetical protein [Streptomyces sp. PH10-H1]MDJ0370668.1 hypothetical protein [Streptomyces sp. H10-C2]
MAFRRKVVAVVVACVTAVTATGALSGCQGGTSDRGSGARWAVEPSSTATGGANGSLDGLTAPEISRRMWDAMNSTTSMTLNFSGVLRTKAMRMKIAMSTDGKCAAAVGQSGWTMQIIRTDDGTSYIKGDPGYWKAMGPKGKSVGELAGSRWIRFPATSVPGRRMSRSCDMKAFLGKMKPNHTSSTKGGPGAVDGQPVVTIRQKDAAGTSILSVAAKGTPYLVKLASARDGLNVTFGDFGEPVRVAAPPANQTIDLTLFGGDSGLGLDA